MRTITFPDEVKNLPETPGVYQFKDAKGSILYIGKAKNLKSRVRSYTAIRLHPKTARMVQDAQTLTYIEVESEFEALLLEARLVRDTMPLFNIELKDDKSPLYIGITKEEYPRLLTLRQTQLPHVPLKYTFGPFVDGGAAKYVLRRLRSIFPFSTHRIGKRACIYQELGLCSPCPSAIVHMEDKVEQERLKKVYLRNIRRLASVLNGRGAAIIKELTADMARFAKEERYEDAAYVKVQIERFARTLGAKTRVQEYVSDPNLIDDLHEKELSDLTRILQRFVQTEAIRRIECYDIAHLAGSNPTASMVTFIDGEPDKQYYRHFKINKGRAQNSDVDSMEEVLTRRMKHFDDWGKPDLIIIDGGKPQIAAAKKVLGNDIPVVGLAKRYETFVFLNDNTFTEYLLPEGPAKNLIVRARNEAHRFARRLHHNLVTKTLLGKV